MKYKKALIKLQSNSWRQGNSYEGTSMTKFNSQKWQYN